MDPIDTPKREVAKLNLRLDPGLRDSAAAVARAMGMSLNSFIVKATENFARYHYGRLMKERQPTMAEAPSQVVGSFEGIASVNQQVPRVGANQPCPCGSGQKYKRCHGRP